MSTPALTRTMHAEWLRLRTVRGTWWFFAAAVVAMIGLATIMGLEERSEPGGPAASAWLATAIATLPGQFAFYGIVLLAVTADYASGGIVPTLQWTPRRGVLFLARTLVPAVVATVAAVALAFAASALVWALVPEFVLPWDEAGASLGKVALIVGAGSLLTIGLGFLFRSTAGGLVTVFLLMLVLPLILPQFGYSWLTDIAEALPGYGAFALLLGTGGEDLGMSTTAAVTVLLAWSLGAIVLGGARLLTHDADH